MAWRAWLRWARAGGVVALSCGVLSASPRVALADDLDDMFLEDEAAEHDAPTGAEGRDPEPPESADKPAGPDELESTAGASGLESTEGQGVQGEADLAVDAANATPVWSLSMSAGAGVGTRSFELPGDAVVYQTSTGLFPVVGLGMRLDHVLSSSLLLGLLARYQTSVGAMVVEQHTDGGGHEQHLRSHHLDLGLSPRVFLDDDHHWALVGALGYAMQDLRPEVHHLNTPPYGLGGPYLRLGLRAPLVSGLLRLRVAPEGQWIVHVTGELAGRGVATNGVALGGEAALELTLGTTWIVGLTYRELRAWLDATPAEGAPGQLADVSRFATVRVTGEL